MATRNIVPRANEEGNIGTTLKNWLKGWFKDLFVSGDITDGNSGISVTVAELDDAVTKKHTQSHAVDSASDHTSTVVENNLMDADGNGLPDDSGLSVTDASDAITKKHTQNTDTALPITGALGSDHTVSGIKTTLTAGVGSGDTINFGDVCYIDSNGKAQLAKADAIANSNALVMCADATIESEASGNFLLLGTARDDTWNWTVGGNNGLIYLSTTGTNGNTLTQTAPSGANNVIQVVGVATHADRMFFNPSLVQIEHV